MVQGFFVGMVANLFPFAPGGVGAVDAGLIGTFVLFDLPSSAVFAAVLTYRLIAFWLPIPPGHRRLPPAPQDRGPLGGATGEAAGRGHDRRVAARQRRRPLLQKVKYDDV